MSLPHGIAEADFLRVATHISNILGPQFAFGPYDQDDIKQMVVVDALTALRSGKYDPSRPLENFLYTHCRNRLLNFRRDRLVRSDPPCKTCHAGTPCGPDGGQCKPYARWFGRNQAKANLIKPLGLDHISDEREEQTQQADTATAEVEASELARLIDENLSMDLRHQYLQMKAGITLPRPVRQKVQQAVLEILRGVGLGPEDFRVRAED